MQAQTKSQAHRTGRTLEFSLYIQVLNGWLVEGIRPLQGGWTYCNAGRQPVWAQSFSSHYRLSLEQIFKDFNLKSSTPLISVAFEGFQCHNARVKSMLLSCCFLKHLSQLTSGQQHHQPSGSWRDAWKLWLSRFSQRGSPFFGAEMI